MAKAPILEAAARAGISVTIVVLGEHVDMRKIALTSNQMEPVMTKHVERELTNQATDGAEAELTEHELRCVSGLSATSSKSTG
jgi:hypothetical protein